MLRLLQVACFFLLSLADHDIRHLGYDPCEGSYVGEGYYNLAATRHHLKRRYDQVELVCDFSESRNYGKVTKIAWTKLDDDGGCRRAQLIPDGKDIIQRFSRSRFTITDYDERDYGVYRCLGTENSGRYNDVDQGRVVYMDIMFRPHGYRYYL